MWSTCTADGIRLQLVAVVAGAVERAPRVATDLLTDARLILALIDVYRTHQQVPQRHYRLTRKFRRDQWLKRLEWKIRKSALGPKQVVVGPRGFLKEI